MDEAQFEQLNTSLNGLNGAINKLAENVSPVDSSVHQAIEDLSANLAKWQAAQTETIHEGFMLLAEALRSRNDDVILRQLQMLTEAVAPLADLPFIKEELSTVHQLVSDLASADPETIKQLTASVKAVREKLQTSVDNQPKGD